MKRFHRLLEVLFLTWLCSSYLGFVKWKNVSSVLYEMFYVHDLNRMVRQWASTQPHMNAHQMVPYRWLGVKVQCDARVGRAGAPLHAYRFHNFQISVTVCNLFFPSENTHSSAISSDELARFGKFVSLNAGNMQYEKIGPMEFNYRMLMDAKLYMSQYIRASSAFNRYLTRYPVNI